MASLLLAPLAITLLLMFSAAPRAKSDTIVVLNRAREYGTMTIECTWGEEGHAAYAVPYGGNLTFSVDANKASGPNSPSAPLCDATAGDIVFTLYSYGEDHGRCRRRCMFDLKKGGLYAWDPKGRMWRLIKEFRGQGVRAHLKVFKH